MQSQKQQNDLCSFQRQNTEYHSNPSLCPKQKRWRSWSWTVPWRPIGPSITNTQKGCPFHYRGLECKSRKSRNTWSNRQIWPWSTEWSRERLIEFCQEDALVIANTLFQQHRRRLYTWTSPDGQHQNQTDYILCSQRWRSSIQPAKARLGADCGSDKELLRPFRYDLNKIPYDYTVEVRNRFKGLDLIERLMNYGWRFVILYRRQRSRPSPRKINAKRQNGCLRRPYK